ncbi:MAG TPA: 2TM domain-containing protein [Flavobacterium sp.]|jgi:hypothetical protein
MNRYVKELLKALGLGFLIFVVLVLIRKASGDEIAADEKLTLTFIFTMLYSVSLYFANAVVFIYMDRRYKNDRFTKRRLLVGFVSSFAITLFIIFLLRIVEEVLINRKSWETFITEEKPVNYTVSVLIFFFVSLSVHAFHFYKAYQENKVQEQKIIAGTASAKFESLKNQIDPHFLFNSLNVLSSLIEENPDNAQRFTTSLSKIYRYVLEQKDKELVSVEEELSFAKTYMNLLKMRFENSLFYELPEHAPDPEWKVVPLSLQLLLENTVKHNIVSEQKPLHIRIFIDGDYLAIQNDFRKKEVLQDRQGVGLQNIVNRYAIITNKKVSIRQDEKTFTVRIPILTKQVVVMETTHDMESDKLSKLHKKVEEIKGFYGNFAAYVLVITGLAIVNLITSAEHLWFLYPAIGWGIGVLVHWMAVYNKVPFLGKEWEEKKIRELMEKERSGKWN